MRAKCCKPCRGFAAGGTAVLAFAMTMAVVPVMAQAPGPELFARDPRTPLELWEASDYLIRTRQAAKAVPYLQRFQQAQPDDATMIKVRDRYGIGSFLRLNDNPATRPFAKPISDRLAQAVRRYTTDPDYVRRYIADLLRSPAEQSYALRRLWESGAHAVPPILEALRQPGLAREDHDLLVRGLGRLNPSAVPPLLAALESHEPATAADAADALGAIGDPGALPFLTFFAATPGSSPSVRDAARSAIERITDAPFDQQAKPPVRVIVDAANWYHRHRPEGREEPVTLWVWDQVSKLPVPRQETAAEARSLLGLRLAGYALRLDPNDEPARVVQTSLALEQAARRFGPEAIAVKTPVTFAAATDVGPSTLTRVLETAIDDGKFDLAAAAVLALAKVTDRASLVTTTGRPHPLVRTLTAPGRRAQFAAARALVDLSPDRPFAGSSLVAKTLARFLVDQARPRAIVIDENASRGAMIAAALMGLGYTTELAASGSRGFRAASESADVELILVAYDMHLGWPLIDTLTNLQADARTRIVPLFVYGPYNLQYTRPSLELDFPGMKFLVPSSDPTMIEKQIGGRPSVLSEAERTGYAREASTLLARIAANRLGPMFNGLKAAVPALSVAVRIAETAPAAIAVLGEIPDLTAQRVVFDVAMDPSRPSELRVDAARRLAAGIGRFGTLITRDQEARFIADAPLETDPAVREALAGVASALGRLRPNATR